MLRVHCIYHSYDERMNYTGPGSGQDGAEGSLLFRRKGLGVGLEAVFVKQSTLCSGWCACLGWL